MDVDTIIGALHELFLRTGEDDFRYVTDQNGLPLPGVAVLVEGTTKRYTNRF